MAAGILDPEDTAFCGKVWGGQRARESVKGRCQGVGCVAGVCSDRSGGKGGWAVQLFGNVRRAPETGRSAPESERRAPPRITKSIKKSRKSVHLRSTWDPA